MASSVESRQSDEERQVSRRYLRSVEKRDGVSSEESEGELSTPSTGQSRTIFEITETIQHRVETEGRCGFLRSAAPSKETCIEGALLTAAVGGGLILLLGGLCLAGTLAPGANPVFGTINYTANQMASGLNMTTLGFCEFMMITGGTLFILTVVAGVYRYFSKKALKDQVSQLRQAYHTMNRDETKTWKQVDDMNRTELNREKRLLQHACVNSMIRNVPLENGSVSMASSLPEKIEATERFIQAKKITLFQMLNLHFLSDIEQTLLDPDQETKINSASYEDILNDQVERMYEAICGIDGTISESDSEEVVKDIPTLTPSSGRNASRLQARDAKTTEEKFRAVVQYAKDNGWKQGAKPQKQKLRSAFEENPHCKQRFLGSSKDEMTSFITKNTWVTQGRSPELFFPVQRRLGTLVPRLSRKKEVTGADRRSGAGNNTPPTEKMSLNDALDLEFKTEESLTARDIKKLEDEEDTGEEISSNSESD